MMPCSTGRCGFDASRFPSVTASVGLDVQVMDILGPSLWGVWNSVGQTLQTLVYQRRKYLIGILTGWDAHIFFYWMKLCPFVIM